MSKRPLWTEAVCVTFAGLFLLGLTIGAVGQPVTPNPPSAGAVTTGDGERVLRSAASHPGTGDTPDLSAAITPTSEPAEKPLATRPGKEVKADKVDKADKADKGTLDIKGDQSGSIESFSVQNQDVRQSLRLLGFKYKRNIVVSPNVSGKVTLDLYNVTLKEVLDSVVTAVGCQYREQGSFIYVYTAKEFEQMQKEAKRMETKTFRLWYTTANDIKAYIKPAMSETGEISTTPAAGMGVGKSDTDAGGNKYASIDMVVIRDYPENLRRIGEIIAEIDVKPQQVLVEAVILVVQLAENSSLGVNFNTLAGVDFRNINATSDNGLASLIPGQVTTPELKFTSAMARTDFGAVTDGLRIGLISNKIAMFVSALETVGDTSVLANPKLLVVDRQRGEVLIGQRQGYKTTTVSQGISSETIEFLETGTRLIVRPYVCKDGNIRLELHPEESTGGLDATGLPQESTATVTSNVVVRDGHTIVIGGLFREETGDTRKQIPLLGNMPYVGTLFRNTSDTTNRKEIIVLVTPHVIQQEPAEAVSEQIRDDVERFRIGQRNGLRWWSRNRLAGSCLQEARTALAAGDFEKAMWYTDMTLSMNPTMEEAIRLKEQMTVKAYWSQQPQDSSVRFVIQRMIMAEMGKPYRPVVYPAKPRDDAKLDPATRKALGRMPLIEESQPIFRSYRATPVVKPAPKTTDQSGQTAPPRTK
ncbi:MAG: hypothetical protein NTV86_21325 [Planctomycetota bacterium]|nr:hypothetical protein [Planctomycetota bacterium]